MSEGSPVIDLSAIWSKLDQKQTEPFCADMVHPTRNTSDADGLARSRRLICQIQIYEAACLHVENGETCKRI